MLSISSIYNDLESSSKTINDLWSKSSPGFYKMEIDTLVFTGPLEYKF